MEKICLSKNERVVLFYVSKNNSTEGLKELTELEISSAIKKLKTHGLILAHFDGAGNVACARITNDGQSYIDYNPSLENPISVDIEKFTRQNLILQNNELEYKKKIRTQESIIRIWQCVAALLGLISLITIFCKH